MMEDMFFYLMFNLHKEIGQIGLFFILSDFLRKKRSRISEQR